MDMHRKIRFWLSEVVSDMSGGLLFWKFVKLMTLSEGWQIRMKMRNKRK